MTETPDALQEEADSCFSAQVNALTRTGKQNILDVITVQIEAEAVQNTVLDTGNTHQVVLDRMVNAFRAVPMLGEAVWAG